MAGSAPTYDFKLSLADLDDSRVWGGACASVIETAEFGAWANALRAKNINRVCCLLTADDIDALLSQECVPVSSEEGCTTARARLRRHYAMFAFEVEFFPIEDGSLTTHVNLHEIFRFLDSGEAAAGTLVHCWAGIGRTGHVLACWLIWKGWSQKEAYDRMLACDRDPFEAVLGGGGITHADVQALFSVVEEWRRTRAS